MAEARAAWRTPAWGLRVPGDGGPEVGPAGQGGPPVRGTVSPCLPLLAWARKARASGPRPAGFPSRHHRRSAPARTYLPPSICFAKQINSAPDSARGTVHLFQHLSCRVGFATSHVPGIHSCSLLTRSPARPSAVTHVMGGNGVGFPSVSTQSGPGTSG